MQSGHHVVAWGARFIGHILGKKSPCFASSLSWRWSAVHASNLILWKGQVHPILCEKIRPRELVFVTGKDQLHFSTGENSGDWTVSVFCSPWDLIGSDQKKKKVAEEEADFCPYLFVSDFENSSWSSTFTFRAKNHQVTFGHLWSNKANISAQKFKWETCI